MHQSLLANPFFIPVDENSYSLLQIGTDAFPMHLSNDDLSTYRNQFANWHKQKEIEISYVGEGAVEVCLPGYNRIFRTGEMFIIFPDHLHAIRKVDGEPGKYRTLIFSPSFLFGWENSYAARAFFDPLMESDLSVTAVTASSKKDLLKSWHSLFLIDPEQMNPKQQIAFQQKLLNLWMQLYFEDDSQKDEQRAPEIRDARIQDTLHYLHTHYRDRFSLTDLANDIHVSRSECCRHFQRCMHMTIVEYLNEYRIGVSMELLRDTSSSITEIAHEVGFAGASNFTERFRKKTGITPSQYRKSL